MLTGLSSAGFTCRRVIASASMMLVLAGTAVAPAYAESVRSKQWHLDVMQAEKMWETSTGAGITVAVLDTGVDASNGDLRGQVLEGLNLEPDSPGGEQEDYDGHGTGMAALIAGTGKSAGGDGAFGLAPGAKILPVRMPDSTGAANRDASDKEFSEAAPKAIRYAVDHGAQIINISLGRRNNSQSVTEAVKYALEKGVLIFAAVGNTGDAQNSVEYPAGTPGVVGVGAVDEELKKTDESQWGPQVDLAAPGDELVYACTEETGLCRGHGTSGATALASASAALIWSKYPDWTNNQVLRVLLNTAGGAINGEKRTDAIGYGIVRPRIALKDPGDPGPADEYPLPDLAAAASPTPSAEPSAAANGSEKSDESEKPAAASPASDDGGNAGLWIGLGVGVAVLVGAGVVFGVVRSRRRGKAATAPAP
ncbi:MULTISPECIES: type VII secretion-associated serine protease mycosin [unclassified Streptomyces]|uniref:type VII secretion-associated serine protease mycosin n=2 Tax=unclassified Streptomyces TaxID=2593676 RepID=UPI0001C1AC6F|nr:MULTISPECIES: type VII secretion-associated serine protease mycosin [unclassified Streptomyces]AEN10305.1 peptidase S8 and S53 subtilisin kexin sedolisin [Streptomyces sp. SirexAA-E]MYS00094.1 type VII secretion-associated serine protease mycosin [Streptomyces sp. SID4940]MYT65456.1 type VII secretion-associated serine protease mycosin [Streptomyces sp. SID8357]MYT84511.1 type VII secretion-associated serine protease mycosin [Streptomyces sp. SID8360]MYW37777.1 type VII secretion-associated